MSEIDKALPIILPYLNGNVLELGSGGWPCVDHAIQMDLHRFHRPPHPPVQLVHSVFDWLPFTNYTFDAVVASHVLEDVLLWGNVLWEWQRVLKVGGVLIIQVPDKERFRAVVEADPARENLGHKHESRPGELTEFFRIMEGRQKFEIIMDRFEPADDYNILAIFKKL